MQSHCIGSQISDKADSYPYQSPGISNILFAEVYDSQMAERRNSNKCPETKPFTTGENYIAELRKVTEDVQLKEKEEFQKLLEAEEKQLSAAHDGMLSMLPQLAMDAAQRGVNGVNIVDLGEVDTSYFPLGIIPNLDKEQQRVFDAVKAMGFTPVIDRNNLGVPQQLGEEPYARLQSVNHFYLRAKW